MSVAADLQLGDQRVTVLVENLTRTQIVQYAGASGDFNPIHTDEIYATQVTNQPTVLAHGMLTMGMAGRLITDWLGVDSITRYGARFRAQVWPGQTLTGTATVERLHTEENQRLADFSITVTNNHGETVLTGNATARLTP
jgi:acyl dehydratase